MKQQQPKALYLLFFTELWERFGFYALQTILVLYMSKRLGFSDKHAYVLYGSFSALLYLTPVIGGYLADRFLGFQRTIIIGGIILLLGYCILVLPSRQCLFLGLSTIIVGNGFFKPNVSSVVGEFYEANDPRREGGFTLFYMGINIGSLIPPLFAGSLVDHFGWHAGFLLAAFGMLIGLISFICGRRLLQGRGTMPENSMFQHNILLQILLYLAIIVSIFLISINFLYPEYTNLILLFASLIFFMVIVYFMTKEQAADRRRMIASLILIVISVGFWALYNQTFSSLMLFADRNMDQQILGFHIDAEFTQFFNPFFIMLLSPILSRLWVSLDMKKINPSIPAKFSLGVVFMTLGFAALAYACSYTGHDGITSPWWLVLSYFLQTCGELLLSPIGLSMITVLTPRHLVSMMMGVWFLSQAFAFSLGGQFAVLTSVPKGASATQGLAIYGHAFWLFTYFSIGLSIICFALLPVLKRLINAKATS